MEKVSEKNSEIVYRRKKTLLVDTKDLRKKQTRNVKFKYSIVYEIYHE